MREFVTPHIAPLMRATLAARTPRHHWAYACASRTAHPRAQAANCGGPRDDRCMGRCRAVPTTLQRRTLATLHATSTSLAIPTAISFASFAQLVLVEAGLSQFAAHIPPNWSLASLPVSAAISFAPLP